MSSRSARTLAVVGALAATAGLAATAATAHAQAPVTTDFALPNAGSQPRLSTTDPDGNVWFTERLASMVGRITPSGAVTTYRVAAEDVRGITARPDGNLWFTSPNRSIGQISTTGAVACHRIPGTAPRPARIAAGADGSVWFTDNENGSIGRVRLAVGTYTRAPRVSGPTLTFAIKGLTPGRVVELVETRAGTLVAMQKGSRLGTRVLAKRYLRGRRGQREGRHAAEHRGHRALRRAPTPRERAGHRAEAPRRQARGLHPAPHHPLTRPGPPSREDGPAGSPPGATRRSPSPRQSHAGSGPSSGCPRRRPSRGRPRAADGRSWWPPSRSRRPCRTRCTG